MSKKSKEKRAERLYKRRLSSEERIASLDRMTLKRAKRKILSDLYFETKVHEIFLNREDLTKEEGISFCKKVNNVADWVTLFNLKSLKFEVPEMLYLATLADKRYNHYKRLRKSYIVREFLSGLSVLNKVLEKEEVVNYFKTESPIALFLLKIRLQNNKVTEAIEKERKNVWDDTEKIIPVRVLAFLLAVVTYIPLTILLSPKIDLYLKSYLDKKKTQNNK